MENPGFSLVSFVAGLVLGFLPGYFLDRIRHTREKKANFARAVFNPIHLQLHHAIQELGRNVRPTAVITPFWQDLEARGLDGQIPALLRNSLREAYVEVFPACDWAWREFENRAVPHLAQQWDSAFGHHPGEVMVLEVPWSRVATDPDFVPNFGVLQPNQAIRLWNNVIQVVDLQARDQNVEQFMVARKSELQQLPEVSHYLRCREAAMNLGADLLRQIKPEVVV